MKSSLTTLENHDAFLSRHIGPSASDESSMLKFLGFNQRDELINAVIPSNIRSESALPLVTTQMLREKAKPLNY